MFAFVPFVFFLLRNPLCVYGCLLQSTYCSNVVKYCQECKRTVHVVNLDPAAETFTYDPVVGEL